jgi:hypothetical protein
MLRAIKSSNSEVAQKIRTEADYFESRRPFPSPRTPAPGACPDNFTHEIRARICLDLFASDFHE